MATDGRERNSQTGQFEPAVPNAEILAAVRRHEPAGTAEVGEAVGLARQNADYRLHKLEEQGRVARKKVGRTLVRTPVEGGEPA